MGRVRWKAALPFALTGATWTPVSSEGPAGVQPTAVSGSFLGVFVCWRAKPEGFPVGPLKIPVSFRFDATPKKTKA